MFYIFRDLVGHLDPKDLVDHVENLYVIFLQLCYTSYVTFPFVKISYNMLLIICLLRRSANIAKYRLACFCDSEFHQPYFYFDCCVLQSDINIHLCLTCERSVIKFTSN